ncbi:unnamed protein product [Prorocentrum cordatum]|uniref:holo-[acyl-carrier-protein] synthase n=1 Tax=Prorocentrum cordatum TaxID=2364126 RepID=A0ABN9TUQ4_9DINO|nr:unnamed protein product [Polarella glacialis]
MAGKPCTFGDGCGGGSMAGAALAGGEDDQHIRIDSFDGSLLRWTVDRKEFGRVRGGLTATQGDERTRAASSFEAAGSFRGLLHFECARWLPDVLGVPLWPPERRSDTAKASQREAAQVLELTGSDAYALILPLVLTSFTAITVSNRRPRRGPEAARCARAVRSRAVVSRRRPQASSGASFLSFGLRVPFCGPAGPARARRGAARSLLARLARRALRFGFSWGLMREDADLEGLRAQRLHAARLPAAGSAPCPAALRRAARAAPRVTRAAPRAPRAAVRRGEDGVRVREGEARTSAELPARLATGSNVEEVVGGRRPPLQAGGGLRPGTRPGLGDHQPERKAPPHPQGGGTAAPGADARSGSPALQLRGPAGRQHPRVEARRFKRHEDQKRALVARLLLRRASMLALGHKDFGGLSISRTKGSKPFLHCPLPPEGEAPNWNANVSHEGEWVVCASEPLCVVGVDVAELRRFGPKGNPLDFKKSMKDMLTAAEWAEVASAGEDLDCQYEVFQRFWSAKEAFVKARGDGLQFELGRAEFSWSPMPGYPDKTAYRGTVAVDGGSRPLWAFVQHRMPGESPHWTTVARGPLADIVDANGEFTRTLRRAQAMFSDKEWSEALSAGSPPFDVVPVGALVPAGEVEAYVRSGGSAP